MYIVSVSKLYMRRWTITLIFFYFCHRGYLRLRLSNFYDKTATRKLGIEVMGMLMC